MFDRAILTLPGEARMLKLNYIGTEHFLFGPLLIGEGIAAQVMELPPPAKPDSGLPLLTDQIDLGYTLVSHVVRGS